MKKRVWAILCIAAMLLLAALPSYAGVTVSHRLSDEAGLLQADQLQALSETLDRISEKWNMDVAVVTVDSTDGKGAQLYADDYYDENGYREDGILLLVCVQESEYAISTTGDGILVFTDAGLEYMADCFVPELSDGDYGQAFEIFADLCDDFLEQADTNEPYDYYNLPRRPFETAKNLLIAAAIGFVLALVIVMILRSRLRSARPQHGAAGYVKDGSLQVTEAGDYYLYSTVTRTRRVENNGGSSTHTSSSGRRHGGRSGRF